MKPPAAKVEAEWRARLADSGFEDLEGPDRDAPLSNRGKLHARDDDNPGDYFVQLEHNGAYTSWALDVLQKLNGHGMPARNRRRIWERYANGESMKTIGLTPGLNFHVVRKTVKAIEEKYGTCKERREHPRRMARSVEPATAVQLAALLLAALSATSLG